MTVISEPISSIAGADNDTDFRFSSPVLRSSSSGTGMVTTAPVLVNAVAGVLTTPNFDPGPATVRVGQRIYNITIPNSGTPVRLTPLIEAGLPIAPAEEASAVVNGGGFARGQVMTADAYAALTSTTTPDPGSVFLVY